MTTSPKGFTQIANTDPPNGPAQINGAELFVENLIGESVADTAHLPSSGNWTGRTIFVIASGTQFIWTGTVWMQVYKSGRVPVKPTSVTGGTLNADGSVTFTAAATIAVDGCYSASASFDSYAIVVDQTTASVNTNLQYLERAGGVDAATAYFWDIIYSASNAVAGANTPNDTAIQLTAQTALYRHTEIEVSHPADPSVRTLLISEDASTDTATMGQSRATGWHGTLASYDGFKIRATVGTITGKLRVFGIGNG